MSAEAYVSTHYAPSLNRFYWRIILRGPDRPIVPVAISVEYYDTEREAQAVGEAVALAIRRYVGRRERESRGHDAGAEGGGSANCESCGRPWREHTLDPCTRVL